MRSDNSGGFHLSSPIVCVQSKFLIGGYQEILCPQGGECGGARLTSLYDAQPTEVCI